MLGDAMQLILQACDQAPQGGARQLRRVEVDVQLQGTATLLGVDDQWRIHRRIGFAPQAAFAQTQAALALVELAQVVEQQLRGALGPLALLGQLTKAQAQIGHGAQLLLDRLEAGSQLPVSGCRRTG